MKELDMVVLQEPLPKEALKKGDVGTIVAIYEGGKGYEVEFVTYTGETIAVTTLLPHQIRAIAPKEMMSARNLTES